MGDTLREPFDAPLGKKERKKRDKIPKERVHIYLTTDSLDRVDEKAKDLGLDRSPCIQVMLNFALNKYGQPSPSEMSAPKSGSKKK